MYIFSINDVRFIFKLMNYTLRYIFSNLARNVPRKRNVKKKMIIKYQENTIRIYFLEMNFVQ